MKMIGLTGGIGSGKSTVAGMLQDHGFPVVDADQLARDIVEPGQPALQDLVAEFGEDIIDADGALRRSELAARAFVDTESTEKLNAITHPRIKELREQRFAEAAKTSPVVIYDMPLLVEQGVHKQCDLVVVVHVTEDERVRRLVASRGLAEDDVRRRIAQQASDEERLAVADVVIDNNGTLEDLAQSVSQLVTEIKQRYVV